MATILIEPRTRFKAVAAMKAAAGSASLMSLDRAVIRLGIADGRISTGRPRLLAALARLAGECPITKLANPKMEALRRYAMLHPRRHPDTAVALAQLQDAGYSSGQVVLIDNLLHRGSAAGREPSGGGGLLPLVFAPLFACLLRVVDAEMGSLPLSALITASIVLPIVPMLMRPARRSK